MVESCLRKSSSSRVCFSDRAAFSLSSGLSSGLLPLPKGIISGDAASLESVPAAGGGPFWPNMILSTTERSGRVAPASAVAATAAVAGAVAEPVGTTFPETMPVDEASAPAGVSVMVRSLASTASSCFVTASSCLR